MYFKLVVNMEGRTPEWIVLVSWNDYEVIPSRGLSPGRRYVLEGCRLAPNAGILLQQIGVATTVLKVAAERCFFDVKMPLLQKLTKKLGMGQSGPNIYDLCKALVEIPWTL